MNWIAFINVLIVMLLCVIIAVQRSLIRKLVSHRVVTPGSVLVIESDFGLSPDRAEALERWAANAGVKVLLLGEGLKVWDGTTP